jgi:hypothetical protein
MYFTHTTRNTFSYGYIRTSGPDKGITIHNKDEIDASSSDRYTYYIQTAKGCSCNFVTVTIGSEIPAGAYTIDGILYPGRLFDLTGTYYADTKEFKYNYKGTAFTKTAGDNFEVLVCNYDPKVFVLDDIATIHTNISGFINNLNSMTPTEQCLIDVLADATDFDGLIASIEEFSDVFECIEFLEMMPDFQDVLDTLYADLDTCKNSITSTTTTEETSTATTEETSTATTEETSTSTSTTEETTPSEPNVCTIPQTCRKLNYLNDSQNYK